MSLYIKRRDIEHAHTVGEASVYSNLSDPIPPLLRPLCSSRGRRLMRAPPVLEFTQKFDLVLRSARGAADRNVKYRQHEGELLLPAYFML